MMLSAPSPLPSDLSVETLGSFSPPPEPPAELPLLPPQPASAMTATPTIVVAWSSRECLARMGSPRSAGNGLAAVLQLVHVFAPPAESRTLPTARGRFGGRVLLQGDQPAAQVEVDDDPGRGADVDHLGDRSLGGQLADEWCAADAQL